MPIRKVAILMTAYNRRDLTLRALLALYGQERIQDIEIETYLVEDACTDGTAGAVREQFPAVHLLHGDGSLYWNGGMRLAFSNAMQRGFDAYVLLNDDTFLDPNGLHTLVSSAESWESGSNATIVVGSTRSPGGGPTTYGGLVWGGNGIRPYLRRVEPDPRVPIRCDTMNGNIVLIPDAVARSIGNLEARFKHQFGDWDYGLRARKSGFELIVAPGHIGECAINARPATWRDPKASLRQRWRSLTSPKGVPFNEWLLFTYRHVGWLWPLHAVSPYIKTLAIGIKPLRKYDE